MSEETLSDKRQDLGIDRLEAFWYPESHVKEKIQEFLVELKDFITENMPKETRRHYSRAGLLLMIKQKIDKLALKHLGEGILK